MGVTALRALAMPGAVIAGAVSASAGTITQAVQGPSAAVLGTPGSRRSRPCSEARPLDRDPPVTALQVGPEPGLKLADDTSECTEVERTQVGD